MRSPRVITIIILAVIFVGGIIGFDILKTYLSDNKSPEEVVDNKEVIPKINIANGDNLTSEDTDGDGLLDWEEGLRGTDPKNPDTDGDGTTDGGEIKEGRDPTVPGPDDSFSLLKSFSADNQGFSNTENTLSNQITRNFFYNYLNLEENGLINDENREVLVGEIVSSAKKIAQTPNKYLSQNIVTFPDYEKERVREYGNSFAEIFVIYLSGTNELKSSGDGTYLISLSSAAGNLGRILSTLPVPSSLLNTHLDFINNVNRISYSLKGLGASKQDPARSLIALGEHETANKDQIMLLVEIADYFRVNDIIFEDEEFGMIWNNL